MALDAELPMEISGRMLAQALDAELPVDPSGAVPEDLQDDDLTWVPEPSATMAAPAAPSTTSIRLSTSSMQAAAFADTGAKKAQILLRDGWEDCQESAEICAAHARNQESCTIRHGRTIAFSGPGLAKQINKGGQERILRLGPPLQLDYGPQSRRGDADQRPLDDLADEHARRCFKKFAENEERHCGEWAVFYHSYSFAALIYEVQAAVASVLFRFRSRYAPLPRLVVHDFHEVPDANTLLHHFNTRFKEGPLKDHEPEFRKVALSVMCSLVCTGPELAVVKGFKAGYSCRDVPFRTVLRKLLTCCYIPDEQVDALTDNIIEVAAKHGLSVSRFGGQTCHTSGHLLQIFIRRSLVDQLAYAAHPYGYPDEDRQPISTWMDGQGPFSKGQARIVAHPRLFMQAKYVHMYVASADPRFRREAFQKELVDMIGVLKEEVLRRHAAAGIWGGPLPAWWESRDQRQVA